MRCPFCGAAGVPAVSAPRAAALLLSVPLLTAACTETKAPTPPPEPTYGAPMVESPAPPSGANTPAPEKPSEADPPPPPEPQNEIYGTPAMMGEVPEPAPE
mgnify:CR=1 FL=1